jgi:hypoxia up-regulated 1
LYANTIPDFLNHYIRLGDMNKADELRRTREDVRNNLEAFIYRLQDLLYDNFVIQVTQDDQRSELTAKLSEISDWLYEDGETASTEELQSRLSDLQ